VNELALPAPAPTFAARALFSVLAQARVGRLRITTPDGTSRQFAGADPGPSAELTIHEWQAVANMVRYAEIGVAECWRDGLIATPDMTAFLEWCVANEKALEKVFYGNPVTAVLLRAAHWLRPNTRSGAKKNIHAHYDLGNSFYSLWLDRTMTYSSAVFGEKAGDLALGQEAKYERLLQVLEVRPEHRVLEIGCGWGGFAEYAARTRGCHVTGITISRAQLDFGHERIRRAGLEGRVDLRFVDYRDVDGRYDRIVSIEMFEAVGERYWPRFFQTVHDRLVPGGRAAIQSITIAPDAFERYRRTSDFIREYIFPGGMLASPERFTQEALGANLHAREPFFFGMDYARTLKRWREMIDARESDVKAHGFDDRFLAIWRFYLCYCEAGFRTKRTDVMQIELARPA
jgi:cyclopropane-fatty-acyl-phospholipid synthase